MLIEKIKNHKIKIGIVGMGYVGLPLAIEFAQKKYAVTGFEIDGSKVQKLRKGESYIKDIHSETLNKVVAAKKLTATKDFSLLKKMDVIIICVPTPLRKTKDPDISFIIASVKKIAANLKKGQLIILESTTYPGTTREIVLPMLARTGGEVGKDFYIAFSPERVDPGNKKYGISNTPKIVGGITPVCTKYACRLYKEIVNEVIPVSSSESAEMVKLLENTFRSVNIGLVNEVALMCDRLGLNVWEIIDAASSKPFGFMPFYPGPGIGGHCIPLDPQYLSWKLKMLNFYARFIELASDINSKMPGYCVRKISDSLNKVKKSLNGSRILVLGISYKNDVGDVRESPALDVIELLKRKEAIVNYHDPYIPQVEINKILYTSISLNDVTLKKQDCVVITTNHSIFDIKKIVQYSKIVFDARNATKGMEKKNIVKL